MIDNKLLERIFFFALLGGAAYLVWRLLTPFLTALALAAIIVTICYPLYIRVQKTIPRHNASISALLSVLLVVVIVVIPLSILGMVLFKEAISVYTMFNSSGTHASFAQSTATIEEFVQQTIPGFSIDVGSYVRQFANFIASNIASIFAETASTIFLFFIALIASFYFFRDGSNFTKYIIQVSPLPDDQDERILKRLANAIRGVATGTVLVALIQGVLTAVGLWVFGFDRAVLWGSVAAIGALIPGIGTTIVFIPAIIFLILTDSYIAAGGVALWGMLAVGLIDNVLGPYLMSRGNNIHPFLTLLSVLGGIALMGPIGFIVGPVIMSLFIVLLELYSVHFNTTSRKAKIKKA